MDSEGEELPVEMPEEVRERFKILKDHLLKLGEHFDHVHIFVQLDNPDEAGGKCTQMLNIGNGNWYARYGQIKEFVVQVERSFLLDPGSEVDWEEME